MKFYLRFKSFRSRKCTWKCRLRNFICQLHPNEHNWNYYLVISWYLHVWNGVAVAAYIRLAGSPPVREILIKFLIINSWGKYEEMLWNPTNVSSHKKTHITIILYVEIRSSWGKYEELAQYLARNISHEEYSSRGFRPNPRTNISSQGIKNLWGIFLARNIPREK